MAPDCTSVSGNGRDAAGRWIRGTSGSPGGRKKTLTGLVRRSTKDGKDVVAFLVQVLKGELPKVSIGDRLRAAEILCDRGWGRPKVSMDVAMPEGCGVLVVPSPVTAEQWSRVAVQHQERLLKESQEHVVGNNENEEGKVDDGRND